MCDRFQPRFFPPRRPLAHLQPQPTSPITPTTPSPTRRSFAASGASAFFLENSWRALTDRIHNELTGIHAVYAHAIYKEQQEKDVFRRHCVRLKGERDVAREKLRRLLGARYEDGAGGGGKRGREEEDEDADAGASESSVPPPPPPPSTPHAEVAPPTTPIRSSYPSPSPSPSSPTPTTHIPPLASPFQSRGHHPSTSTEESDDGGTTVRVSKRRRIMRDDEEEEDDNDNDDLPAEETTTTTTTTAAADNASTTTSTTPAPAPATPATAPPATTRRQCMTTNHVNLMYMPVNDKLVCRVCVSRTPQHSAPPKIFMRTATWEDLADHCERQHPTACEEVAGMRPAEIMELQLRMLHAQAAMQPVGAGGSGAGGSGRFAYA